MNNTTTYNILEEDLKQEKCYGNPWIHNTGWEFSHHQRQDTPSRGRGLLRIKTSLGQLGEIGAAFAAFQINIKQGIANHHHFYFF